MRAQPEKARMELDRHRVTLISSFHLIFASRTLNAATREFRNPASFT